jgi:dihydroflavonol-4-reductase
MPSLVTGATGLVGFHIVEALLRSGERPRVLVRSVEKARALFGERVELVSGDVTDEASIRNALRSVETVFHAAGHPEQWLRDSGAVDRVNAGGTRTGVSACRGAGVRRLVFTSTIDVFEARPGERFNEDVLAREPKGTPYERSKQLADQVVAAAVAEGLDAVFLHPAAVYGPGPAQSRGINDFVKDLEAGKVPALLPGGMPVVFAPDVGEAHLRAARRASAGERFIVSESFVTLRDLAISANAALGLRRVPMVLPLAAARALSRITEAAARVTGLPPLVPAGQLHFLQWGAVPDATRARERLGLEFTTLEAGLAALVASWKAPNGQRRHQGV